MHLLKRENSGKITLTEYPNETVPPPYAILSHTWGSEEVLFEDIQNGRNQGKLGYRKINFCADQAKEDGLDYFWVDTCCINKANLTELTESIVSMFRWYRQAVKCYVYLTDVSHSSKRIHGSNDQLWMTEFRASRWFTRGWTLQELIAPTSVEFFSADGHLLGSRLTLISLLSTITTIPIGALQGASLADYTVQERMRWAATRSTTKIEDKAYCMQGLFDVHMVPIYGEGQNASVRLIDEICKSQLRQLHKITHPLLMPSLFPPATVSLNPCEPPVLDSEPKPDQRKQILEALRFNQIDDRRDTIRSAYAETCAWLTHHRAYMDWLDPQKYEEHNGLLWIKGKPGTGKSTLVKYAFSRADKSPRNGEFLLCYFFNAGGDALEKSTSGMYRSLLHQLLQKTEICQVFEGTALSDVWPLDHLRELFTAAIRHLEGQSIKCYIDALDECDEQEVRDMIAHFKGLGNVSGGRFCVCFASRYYPTIVIAEGDGAQILLENEIGHGEDLVKYIQQHLKVGQGTARANLEVEVHRKANSVFMWAVLVIEILNDEFRRGSIFHVRKRLNEIPAKLSDLFRDILLRDGARREELLLCIQWVLFAKRPLTPDEYYFAMAAGLADEPTQEWDSKETSTDDMARYVSSSSKGLVELTKSEEKPTVQFIHESVRDFLLKDGGLYNLWPELKTSAASLSHGQLSKCCQNALKAEVEDYLVWLWKQSVPERSRPLYVRRNFPFLRYAVRHVFDHADEAAKVLPADKFLTEFDTRKWIELWNTVEHEESRCFTRDAPLCFVLAVQNAAWLMRKLLQFGTPMAPTPNELNRHPLLAAMTHRQWDVTRVILESYNDTRLDEVMHALKRQTVTSMAAATSKGSPLHWAISVHCESLARLLIASPTTDLDLEDHHGQTPLSLAAQSGCEVVMKLLLSKGAADSKSCTALYCASAVGFSRIVECLIGAGFDVNASCKTAVGRVTPLHAACDEGHVEVVRVLLDAGADVNAPGSALGHPLYTSKMNGHAEVTRLLLAAGANFLVATDANQALLNASSHGHVELMHLLLDAGADVNTRGHDSKNALFLASMNRRVEAVKVLLNADADVNAHTSGMTTKLIVARDVLGTAVHKYNVRADSALSAASLSGRSDIIELLLSRGAEVESQGPEADSALCAASASGRARAVKLLIDAGADVNACKDGLNTALAIASLRGRVEVIELLLESGASVDHPGARIALSRASFRGDLSIVRLLIRRGVDNQRGSVRSRGL